MTTFTDLIYDAKPAVGKPDNVYFFLRCFLQLQLNQFIKFAIFNLIPCHSSCVLVFPAEVEKFQITLDRVFHSIEPLQFG